MIVRSARVVATCAAVLVASACPPPFATLPFPAAGEGEGEGAVADEGEGEGEGEGALCPGVQAPTCTTAFATELDAWTRIDVTSTNDGIISALALDPATSTIVIGNVDGELYRDDPSTGGAPTLIATCPTPGAPAESGPVVARRIFVLDDGTIVASGTNGICLVNGDGSNVFATFLGDFDAESALVPLGTDLLGVSVTSTDTPPHFNFMHCTHTGTQVACGTIFATPALPGPDQIVVDAIALPGNNGALVADEDGTIYFVDAAFTAATVVATLPAAPPSGLVLQAIAGDVEVALMTSSDLEIGNVALSSLESASPPLSTIANAITRDTSRFTSPLDRVSDIAMRARDNARLDVGPDGYATYATTPSDVAPIGACTRVAGLVDISGALCGSAWGVVAGGGLVAWDANAAQTDAVSFLATATGTTVNFGARFVVPTDDTHALLAGDGGFSVLTRQGAALVVKDVFSGMPAIAGFGVGSPRSVAVGEDGTARTFDASNANPGGTVQLVDGSLGTAVGAGNNVVVVTDPIAAPDGHVAFYAAGLVATDATLLHCDVDVVGRELSCDQTVSLGLDNVATFSSIAATATGVAVLTNVGPAFVATGASTATPVSTTAIVAGDDPWESGNGRLVDVGNGCIFVTGDSATPYVFDSFDVAPALALTNLPALTPFPTVATRLDDHRLLASGGGGATFYEIDFDAAVALPCAQRFANATARILGPTRPQSDLTSAVFVGDDAYAGDVDGNLWKLPRF